MTPIWLILTSPYGYQRSAARVAELIGTSGGTARVIFAIDVSALGDSVDTLRIQGWLGPGPLRTLQGSLLDGYRSLAPILLNTVREWFESRGLTVQTEMREQELGSLVDDALAAGAIVLLASSFQHRLPRIERVELVEEA